MSLTTPTLRLTACAAIVLFAGLSCRDTITQPSITAVALRLPQDSLFYGRTMTAVAIATGDSAAVQYARFIWTSSDTSVAVVDSLGVVLGVGVGQARIRAALGDRSQAFTLRVVLQRADGGVPFVEGSRAYGSSACAITTRGEVYCLEAATATDTVLLFHRTPGADGIAFTEVHSSINPVCALATTGEIYCWGKNSGLIFATRLPTEATSAFPVATGALRFSRMTLDGHAQICAVSRADRVVYCWGHNDFYQLMRPPKAESDTTVAPVAGSHRGIDISTSNFATCLLDLSGAAWCSGGFGADDFSLGVDGGGGGIGTPEPVLGGEHFVSISVGEGFECAVSIGGDGYCWGYNSGGRLGIGTAVSPLAMGPQLVAGNLKFASITVSYPNAACGITQTGDLYCWGAFTPSTLASRLGARAWTPYQIARGVKFRALTRRLDKVCGVTTSQTIVCW